jgi:S1-C subfamily serine protease
MNHEMKTAIAILVFLFIIIAFAGGFTYWQQGEDLEEVLNNITTYNKQVDLLQSKAFSINTKLSVISKDINSYTEDTASLSQRIINIGADNYTAPFVFSLLEPSTVRIEVSTRVPGTGIILTADGSVLTNSHVIENSTFVRVVLTSGESYSAVVVASDTDLDLAILDIESDHNNFTPATFGNQDNIIIGEEVLALGFPYYDDLSGDLSATKGIVSSIRYIESYGYHYIQTDAEISLGFGGGPLVNMRGEVIGINTWGLTQGEGITFAITIENIKQFINNTII